MTDDIDAKFASLGDWRGERLARIRAIIKVADPEVIEEIKWRKPTNPLGVPAWSHAGILCTGESYKDKVKLTFAYGNALEDPSGLFTDAPTGTRRAIDLREADPLDEPALAALIREAVRHNLAKKK